MNTRTILTLVCLLLMTTLTAFAEDAVVDQQQPDLSGTWTALVENSYSRRQVTFHLEHKDGRLRGTMVGRGVPEQKVDGRLEEDGQFFLWATLYDKSGRSIDSNFKGQLQGGELVGKGRLMDKPYDFRATRQDEEGES